jgi:hypothetical protein
MVILDSDGPHAVPALVRAFRVTGPWYKVCLPCITPKN